MSWLPPTPLELVSAREALVGTAERSGTGRLELRGDVVAEIHFVEGRLAFARGLELESLGDRLGADTDLARKEFDAILADAATGVDVLAGLLDQGIDPTVLDQHLRALIDEAVVAALEAARGTVSFAEEDSGEPHALPFALPTVGDVLATNDGPAEVDEALESPVAFVACTLPAEVDSIRLTGEQWTVALRFHRARTVGEVAAETGMPPARVAQIARRLQGVGALTQREHHEADLPDGVVGALGPGPQEPGAGSDEPATSSRSADPQSEPVEALGDMIDAIRRL